jgi:hypothetical protein
MREGGAIPLMLRRSGAADDDVVVAVEARVAESLLDLTRPRRIGGQMLASAPYVRRHLVEHAAAGRVLNGRAAAHRRPVEISRREGDLPKG